MLLLHYSSFFLSFVWTFFLVFWRVYGDCVCVLKIMFSNHLMFPRQEKSALLKMYECDLKLRRHIHWEKKRERENDREEWLWYNAKNRKAKSVTHRLNLEPFALVGFNCDFYPILIKFYIVFLSENHCTIKTAADSNGENSPTDPDVATIKWHQKLYYNCYPSQILIFIWIKTPSGKKNVEYLSSVLNLIQK